jgi:hypothetical protein
MLRGTMRSARAAGIQDMRKPFNDAGAVFWRNPKGRADFGRLACRGARSFSI